MTLTYKTEQAKSESPSPLWQKNEENPMDDTMMQYMTGDDILLDTELIHYDILASQAHVEGLAAIELLTKKEAERLCSTLAKLAEKIKNKELTIGSQFEDGHSAIESYLTEQLGELGKKIHTGRSRNDQVAVATRLYLKDALAKARAHIQVAAESCLIRARETQGLAMPGYTHLQRAVPSSAGMWFAGLAEAMLDNLLSVKATLDLIDANPLGTAAGYGVNLPLDRSLTTARLGFARTQLNPIYTQNSRGKFELAVLNSLSLSLLDVRRFCWDLSLFTTDEFDFVRLPDTMLTGSSIMPNKKNPDLIELMRASYAQVQACTVEIQSLLSLPSGYQRDLQLTKGPMIRGIKRALDTLALLPNVIDGIHFKKDKLADAITGPMYATDLAVELSSRGVPFRDAYRQVATCLDELDARTPAQSLEQRVSQGACGNLALESLEQRFSFLCEESKKGPE